MADYFSLGNRKDAFTKISLHVAHFPEYRRKIIDHVYRVKLHHWDEAIRQLACEALHELTPFDPEYIVAVVLPYLLLASQDPKDIPVRHGAILGLAECVLALGEREQAMKDGVSTSLMHEIAEIVPTIEKKRLYRGRGGEIVRRAVCRLIQCICAAKIPLLARQQVSTFPLRTSNNLKHLLCSDLSWSPVSILGPAPGFIRRLLTSSKPVYSRKGM